MGVAGGVIKEKRCKSREEEVKVGSRGRGEGVGVMLERQFSIFDSIYKNAYVNK